MRIYKFIDKAVLLVTHNPDKLLNGITSNTIDASKNAFLDKFGKIIASVDQVKISEDSVLLLVSSSCLQQLYTHLKPYIQLSGTKVQATKYFVYFDLDSAYKIEGNEFSIPQSKGQLVLTEKKMENTVSDEEFLLFRLENNIPLHGVDYSNEMVLNVSSSFVSFTKGCYLGQEVVARVHHLGKPPKKLVADLEKKKFVFVDNR
ncbi:MAG: tRNA-modifying protein YgfZ [Nanoarchaeota archaeon]